MTAVATAAIAPPKGIRLAVIDHDPDFVAGLDQRCRVEGWAMSWITSTRPDPQSVRAAKVNALLLDPAGMDERGRARLGPLCEAIPDIAVVVCTGPSSVAERVRGLRLGADDWITKPCDLSELMARIERLTRDRGRTAGFTSGVDLVAGEIELRPDGHLVRVRGSIVSFSPREFDLLRLFMIEVGQPLDRDDIFRQVWGFAKPWGDRSVDAYVVKLRNKLRRLSPGFTYIHTHHRLGYRFEPRALSSGSQPWTAP
jgi:DNA-binding response OmpR family regulator